MLQPRQRPKSMKQQKCITCSVHTSARADIFQAFDQGAWQEQSPGEAGRKTEHTQPSQIKKEQFKECSLHVKGGEVSELPALNHKQGWWQFTFPSCGWNLRDDEQTWLVKNAQNTQNFSNFDFCGRAARGNCLLTPILTLVNSVELFRAVTESRYDHWGGLPCAVWQWVQGQPLVMRVLHRLS